MTGASAGGRGGWSDFPKRDGHPTVDTTVLDRTCMYVYDCMFIISIYDNL